MGKRIAILQSNYIPWKGYFDLIRAVDEFIVLDNVQYTRQDWRNRNRIKTSRGSRWLSIPVSGRGTMRRTIAETAVSDHDWPRKHWMAICQHYRDAPYFSHYRQRLEDTYLSCDDLFLGQINERFRTLFCELLGIRTKIALAETASADDGPTERLIELCRNYGATEYLSGPAARSYLRPELFVEAGITVRYVDYGGYPEYPQLFPPFNHELSILDLVLNTGPEALRYMKSF